jgi:hypothetical protein
MLGVSDRHSRVAAVLTVATLLALAFAGSGSARPTIGEAFGCSSCGGVIDENSNPVSGATVTLYASSSPSGPFSQVASGSAILSPATTTNPEVTGASGAFGWGVEDGYYEVIAQKSGCHAPGDASQLSVTSGVLAVPPGHGGLTLRLMCGPGGGGSGGGGSGGGGSGGGGSGGGGSGGGGGGGGGGSGQHSAGSASLGSSSASVSSAGGGQFTLSCGGGMCTGSFEIDATGAQAARAHGKRPAKVLLARGTYSVPAGPAGHVRFQLTAKGKALLRRHHGHLQATLILTPRGGHAVAHRLTLVTAKKPKRHH